MYKDCRLMALGTFLLFGVFWVPSQAGAQTEFSPAVNVHCSNTILRAYNTSIDDAKQLSDQELEDLNNELSEVCKPKQGWTTKDQLYRALALDGILSERLLRSLNSNTRCAQEATELYGQIKILRSENGKLRDQLKKSNTH